MKWVLALLVLALIVLHQDFWLWEDKRLVFGFLPMGLAYHMLSSCAAAALMAALVKFAWPADLERLAETPSQASNQGPIPESDGIGAEERA